MGKIGPVIGMHSNLKCVYIVYLIEKVEISSSLYLSCVNYGFLKTRTLFTFLKLSLQCNAKDVTKFSSQIHVSTKTCVKNAL